MIATMDAMELLDASDELANAVLHSDVFSTYKYTKRQMEQNPETQTLMHRFGELKEAHEEVQRFGKYHPDYAQVSKDIRVVKRELDKDEAVMAFKEAEKELEDLLNELSGTIAHAVSSSIKVPTGNPFFDNMSCSGGCGSGNGCSCG
ncbi:YlbF family regulator [Shouchella shacheensis]|uniref:YlbF family regulator n=1 Tax=Shouchella shacheensis TaxID=1649580 RepID=UPI00073FABDB|nr:YlbF family regulator [Shouchella shacheensis]